MEAELPQAVEVFESYYGIKVPVGPHLTPRHRVQIAEGGYEWAEIGGVRAIVQPGDRVLECGTGVGVVSAVAAFHGGAEAVLCFEGNPVLIEPIRSLHKLNELDGMMEVRNQILLAGPNQPDHVKFNVRGNFLGSRVTDIALKGSIVEIPTADYATVKEEFRPNVILMDIEGGESDFLAHADLTGIRAIIVEFHPEIYGVPGMRECKNTLLQQGFARLECSTRAVWAMVRELPV